MSRTPWELVKHKDGTEAAVRIFKRGAVWWGSYVAPDAPTVNGRQKQTRATLGTRYTEPARAKARQWDRLLNRGIDPVEDERHAVSLTEFIDLLDTDKGPWRHSPTRIEAVALWNKAAGVLGTDRPLSDITEADIENLLDAYRDGRVPGQRGPVAAGTVNSMLSYLKSGFRWAVRRKPPLLTRNPARDVERYRASECAKRKTPTNKLARYTADDVDAMIRAAGDLYGHEGEGLALQALFAVMFDTGARPSEVIRQVRAGIETHPGLHWDHIHLETTEDGLHGFFTIDAPKAGSEDSEPLVRLLSRRARDLLARLGAEGNGYVWPWQTSPKKPLQAVKDHASVDTPGQLEPFRRGHATRLRELGARVEETAASLGHTDVQTQQRHYTLADRAHQRSAMAIIENDNRQRAGADVKEVGA